MIVSAKQMPPLGGTRRRPGTAIDPLALDHGPVELRLSAALRALGLKNPHRARELQELGFLRPGPSGGRHAYYLVDVRAGPEGMFIDWFEGLVAAKPDGWRYADFRKVHRVRTILGIEPTAHLAVLERLALEDMLDMGALNGAEVTARLHPPEAGLPDVLRRLRREAGLLLRSALPRKDGRRPRTAVPIDLDTFRELLPVSLARVPRTCFDETLPDMWGTPSEAALGRIAALGPFRERAVFATLIVAGRARRPAVVDDVVRLCERVEEAFIAADADPGDPVEVGRVLAAYLSGTLLPDDRDAVRHDVVLRYLSVCRHLDAAVRSRSREALRACAPYAWTRPAGFDEAASRCRAEDRRLRKEGNDRRQRRAAVAKDDLDRLLVCLDLRRDQLAACGDAAADADTALAAQGVSSRSFAVRGPGLRPDGSIEPVQQSLEFTAWREIDFLEDLIAVRGPSFGADSNLDTRIADLRSGDRTAEVYLEYHGATTDSGAPGIEPFWASLLATGAWCRPALLPPALADARRGIVKEWRLPGPVQAASGLFGFDRAGGGVFRAAAARGRMVLPIVQFDHAMRFAHLAARQGIMTGARPHESLQIARATSRMRPVEAAGHETHQGWLARPKVPHERPLPKVEERCYALDTRTWAYAEDLARLTGRRCHGGADLPSVAPPKAAAWKLGPMRLFHSFGGRALDVATVNHFLRFLTAGLAHVLLHDLRHADANRLKHAGVPTELRALMHGHSPWHADYYATDTEGQLAGARTAVIADVDARRTLGVGAR